MIGTSVMKELTYTLTQLLLYQNVTKELFLYSVYNLLKHSSLIPVLKLQWNFVQHNTTSYNSMTRFVVTAVSDIQSSLCLSTIWFRKASTCPELAVIGQDGNTENIYLSRENRLNWLKIYIYVLFAVLLPQLEVIAVYRFAALPSYLILLLI